MTLSNDHSSPEGTPGSAEQVARIEVGLLVEIFDAHPQHLTAAELLGRMEAADPSNRDEEGAVERALGRLQQAGLVSEANGAIIPTPAALHFDELPF